MGGEDWSRAEIDAAVADYFVMLSHDVAGRPYNKAAHNRALQKVIKRSGGSIEFKHQNISAVMAGLGHPWIIGYKPAANFQNALVDCVLRWLDRHNDWLLPPRSGNRLTANIPGQARLDDLQSSAPILFGPAPSLRNEPSPLDQEFMVAIARKHDVAARDARNRALGYAGEEAVFQHEQHVLRQADLVDLARKVRWTSQEDGDGYGYDIASFEPDGTERLLEVKTTNGWDRTPFHISANELAVADMQRDTWHLVRLWDFARKPKAFALQPPLGAHAELTPTSFLASLK